MIAFGVIEFLFMIFYVIIPLGIIAAIAWVVYRTMKKSVDKKDALSILKERYARGEISREEYLQMKEDLERR